MASSVIQHKARAPRTRRVVNRDGSLVVDVIGGRQPLSADLYHVLLTLSWPRFLIMLVVANLLINGLFALAYFACGPGALEGIDQSTAGQRLLGCFFFSVQTFATIGYGRITPQGVLPNFIVTFEAMVGMLEVAVATGLVFSRFSRPTSRVVFSDKALITTIDGERCFVFRMANERLNQIVDARVRVTLLKTEKTREGVTYRNMYDLKLEREHTAIFALTLTVVHPLTAESPLANMTVVDMKEADMLLIVSVLGLDETFSQSVHSRYTYSVEDIIWDRQFVDVLGENAEGVSTLNLGNLSAIGPEAPLQA